MAFALRFYDVDVTEADVARRVALDARGTSLLQLAAAAESLGMRAVGERQNLAALRGRRQPTLAWVGADHFVVVVEADGGSVLVFDPAVGLVRRRASDFERSWNGYALTLRFPPDASLDRLDARLARGRVDGGGG
jgi:ABC-type bacteriocin/lantibiotic exporter with double-glycine peptidase domain